MPHTFKAPVNVLISKYSPHDANSLQTVDSLSSLYIWAADLQLPDGYTKVGVGTVEITIATPDQIITGKVETLRAELARDRAESQQRQNALIRKISEIEALTYEQPATV